MIVRTSYKSFINFDEVAFFYKKLLPIAVPPYPCVEQQNGSYRKWSVWLCEHCVKFLADSKRSHFFGWKKDGRTAVPMGWTAKCPLWKLISMIARALCEVFNPIEEVAHFSQFWPYRRTRALNRGDSGIKLSIFISKGTYFCAELIKKVTSFGQTPGTLSQTTCKILIHLDLVNI